MKSYGTFLKEDLPAAVDLLGPNPSAASQEKWERLQRLEEEYARYWAATLARAAAEDAFAANASARASEGPGPIRGPTPSRQGGAGDNIPPALARIERELPREAIGMWASARFSQVDYSRRFSETGRYAFSRLTGREIETIDHLADAIRNRVVDADEVPVIFVVKNGVALIYNTRTAVALERAGVPRSRWLAVNKTGDPDIELILADRLRRNDLVESLGIDQVVPK
jgi:hypothetical protein